MSISRVVAEVEEGSLARVLLGCCHGQGRQTAQSLAVGSNLWNAHEVRAPTRQVQHQRCGLV